MPSAVCQSWGNVQCSNNASVLCSVKWWKQPVITGIIKTVRGSSMDGSVYWLCLSQHHKLQGFYVLSLRPRPQKIIATVPVLDSNYVKVSRWADLKSCSLGTTLPTLSAYILKALRSLYDFISLLSCGAQWVTQGRGSKKSCFSSESWIKS